MSDEKNDENSIAPKGQGPAVTASRPNKIGRKPTPYE